MVPVFVGEEDGVNIDRSDPDDFQPGEGFARTESGIDHYGGVAAAQDSRVATAAAAKDEEFHGADGSGRGARRQMPVVSGLAKSPRGV